MRFEKFNFEGYKAYKNETSICILPITLIYGQNSAGKSSLIRLLPIFRESVINADIFPLKLSAAVTKSATPPDIFSKSRNDGEMQFELHFKEKSETVTVRYLIKLFDRETPVIIKFHLKSADFEFDVELDLNAENPLDYDQRRYIVLPNRETLAGFGFVGLRPCHDAADEAGAAINKQLLALNRHLDQFSGIRWLGPLRKTTPRLELLNRSIREINENGEGAAQILYADSKDGSIFKRVSTWFKDYCDLSLQIVAGAHTLGGLASLALSRLGTAAMPIPLEDTGEGMSQVLPVLVMAAMAAEGRFGMDAVICLEHPDLHLHSNAHYGVIDYLIACTKSVFKPRFIVESHSEAVLTSAQLAIMNGDLPEDQYIAYQITTNSDGVSSADGVRLQRDGNPVEARHLVLDWFSVSHSKAMELARKKIIS